MASKQGEQPEETNNRSLASVKWVMCHPGTLVLPFIHTRLLSYYCSCFHSFSLNTYCHSSTAAAPLKPLLVTVTPPVLTTVRAITRNQPQSARTTPSSNCVSTSSANMHTGKTSHATNYAGEIRGMVVKKCIIPSFYWWLS